MQKVCDKVLQNGEIVVGKHQNWDEIFWLVKKTQRLNWIIKTSKIKEYSGDSEISVRGLYKEKIRWVLGLFPSHTNKFFCIDNVQDSIYKNFSTLRSVCNAFLHSGLLQKL